MGYTISLIGAGSLYTLPLVKTFVSYSKDFVVDRINMYDIDEERELSRFEASKILVKELNSHTEVIMCKTLKEAVTNVDYCLIQIRSGGLDGRVLDEKIPLLHGCIGQETCGAGGLMYGMRSIKDTLEIVKTARENSPNAWIINYSNPASILAEATRRYFDGDDKIVYLCDMTILMQNAYEEALGLENGELKPIYFGLNHFGWYMHLYDSKGVDRINDIKEKLKQGNVVPNELKNDSDWVKTFKMQGEMVTDFDGYIPSTYLEYYYYPNRIVKESDPNNTRAVTVRNVKQYKVENTCKKIIEQGSTKDAGLADGLYGKYIMDFIYATTSDSARTTFLIPVKNGNSIPNISADATVEIPCKVNKHGIEKTIIGEVDYFYKGLIENLYASERLVCDGVLEDDLNKVLKGFVLNRTINDADVAKNLLRDMLEENKEHFPALYKQIERLK